MGSDIFGWGSDDAGQLGAKDHAMHSTPWELDAPETGLDAGMIKAVSAGMRHSLALTKEEVGVGGEVWAWGDNRFGQLGDNLVSIGGAKGISRSSQWGPDLAPVDIPVRVAGMGGVGFLTGVKEISAGRNHNLARDKDGKVWAWGYNHFGQLGDNTRYDRWVPVPVRGPEGRGYLSDLGVVQAIAAGFHHSLALLNVYSPAPGDLQSQIWAWGENRNGQLGDGSTEDRRFPVRVRTPRRSETVIDVWVEIAAGGSHSLARWDADGTVWAWGSNDSGQLGNGNQDEQHLPVQVGFPPHATGRDRISRIAAGAYHSLAIEAATLEHPSRVLTWGGNQFGQLGNGNTRDHSLPDLVVGRGGDKYLEGVERVCGGWHHSLALRSSATVLAWGSNFLGQLGDGTRNSSSEPVQVQGYSGSVQSSIAAGMSHSLAGGR